MMGSSSMNHGNTPFVCSQKTRWIEVARWRNPSSPASATGGIPCRRRGGEFPVQRNVNNDAPCVVHGWNTLLTRRLAQPLPGWDVHRVRRDGRRMRPTCWTRPGAGVVFSSVPVSGRTLFGTDASNTRWLTPSGQLAFPVGRRASTRRPDATMREMHEGWGWCAIKSQALCLRCTSRRVGFGFSRTWLALRTHHRSRSKRKKWLRC